jgi:hypothetical protein
MANSSPAAKKIRSSARRRSARRELPADRQPAPGLTTNGFVAKQEGWSFCSDALASVPLHLWHYCSCRSTEAGWTRMAFVAGMAVAMAATAQTRRAARASNRGSEGPTP